MDAVLSNTKLVEIFCLFIVSSFLLVNASYRKESIECLSEGLNKAVGLVGKVIFFIKHENVAPL